MKNEPTGGLGKLWRGAGVPSALIDLWIRADARTLFRSKGSGLSQVR